MDIYSVKAGKLLGMVIILITSIILILRVDIHPQESTVEALIETEPTKAQQLSLENSKPELKTSTTIKSSIETGRANHLIFDDADWYEIKQWKESRGYYSDADIAAYKSYNLETLSQLAQGGDIAAIQTLAEHYLSEGRKDIAKIAYFDAATRGSTYALTMAAQLNRMEYGSLDSTGQDGRAELIEAFALYQTAILRGDKEILSSHIEPFTKIYGTNFSPEEKAHIEMKAQLIYESLEERRDAMGLDSFNNHTSDLISNYQTYMTQAYTSTQ